MSGKEKQETKSNIGDNYEAALLNFPGKEAAVIPLPKEKKEQSDDLDTLMSDLLKQVITESDQLHPNPETTKAENLHISIGTEKPKAAALKPGTESSAVIGSPEEKATSAKSSSIKPTAKPAAPIFAAPASRKSKTPLIAVACLCVLAAIGIPIYIFTGSSSHVSKPAEPQHTALASSPTSNIKAVSDGRTAAVPIVKVVPKYPNLGVRGKPSASVVLELSIDDDGTVVKATPLSGSPLFYNAAIDTANQWRFKPASLGGKNVPSRSRITLNFRP